MRGFLRSVWDEPRPPGQPARGWRDWALVAVLVPAVLIEGFVRHDLPMRWFQVAVAVALVPLLPWRRSRPLLVVAITFVACGLAPLVIGEDLSLNTFAYVLLLGYALFRWGAGREAVLGSAVIAAKIVASWWAGYLTLGDVVAGFVLVSLVGALGFALRYRAASRARELEQVALLERERLARDLHDTVAHHVSAMVIRAQAGLATADSRPEAATDALRVIEAEATRALQEMRSMVHALRRDSADFAPARRIHDIVDLARSGAAPTVEVELDGDLDAVPSAVDSAVFRMAQESVTNAQRHARHASRVTVRVAANSSWVRLEVADDGDVPAPRGHGFGLIGMAERAALLGGVFAAGPGPAGGWLVTAQLPRPRSDAA